MSAPPSATPARRGLILHALLAQYPLVLTQATLERQLQPFFTADPQAQRRDLAYLLERGFVERDEHSVGGRTFATWRLTSKGVDLVERVTRDDGVEIAE